LAVAETFVGLQGESTFAGLPCAFVRLGGCNLRCTWCDTVEAREGGRRRDRAEVRDWALGQGTRLVELTGGEPLLQPAAPLLMAELCDAGRTVLCETNGSVDISVVDPRVRRIVDLKPPGSGQCAENRFENLALLTDRDELKFVLADRRDYDWMREVIRRHDLAERGLTLLASVVHGRLELGELAEWVLADRLEVRVQPQLHKLIGAR